MSLAEPLPAHELFPHVEITRKQLEPCLENLDSFMDRYVPEFYRIEQSEHARTYIEGLLSDLPRKTIEPIATDHDEERRPLQRFVGAGLWDDEKVLLELQVEVRQEIGDPQGILVLDGSGFPKKGTESVGVKRQWCGRLGKQDNCQVGIYLGYVGSGSAALVDRQLYLPIEWCRRPSRRDKCHVPKEIRFRTSVQIADDLLKKDASRFPHAWITGDDEFGRASWFRHALGRRGERYLLDVPGNTTIRDLEALPPAPTGRRGGVPKTPFAQAQAWALAQPASSWTTFLVRNAEKGPLQVEAIRIHVETCLEKRRGFFETLLVTRNVEGDPEYRFHLSNADSSIALAEMVRVAKERRRIEDCFEQAKGEAGLAHYEVRSWLGWHHHMTLSLLASWFLVLEQRRVGKKDSGSHRPADGFGSSRVVA